MLKLIKNYMGARIQQIRAETEQIHTEIAAQAETAAQLEELVPVALSVIQSMLDEIKRPKAPCSAPTGRKSSKELVDLALSCISELGARRADASLFQIATATADANSNAWPPPPASGVRASAG